VDAHDLDPGRALTRQPRPEADAAAEQYLMRHGCHPAGCLMAAAVLGYILLCLLW
jgi:hypothetical protein